MTTPTLKNRHRLRHRAPRLALVALTGCAALLCSSAAGAANLTCGTNGPNGAKATFTTAQTVGDPDWTILGPRKGFTSAGWYAVDQIANNDGEQGNTTWANVKWMTPGDIKYDHGGGVKGWPSGRAYFFRQKVDLDPRIDPSTVKVDTTQSGAFVDDCLNNVYIRDAAWLPTTAEQDKDTACGDPMRKGPGTGKTEADVYSWALKDALFDGAWQAGTNYMIWKVSNNQARHARTGSNGPTGLFAKVTLTATCKAQPGSGTGAAVPVNNPWALGLLGVAVAGAAARSRRRRK